ncbi:aldose 1-epimerase family protein [Nocardioides panaciterrulae]|uniref:Aldose 1-epimerase n=1 Tax=Nocardioides panaciterrulae TaxID=661492 RepID=A0A7Y9E709_9ACTN|nr:aldose 1-epimerase family protein [Nocardioides panaciterrulae]NYD42031.1 aldose 1-epimerase [Nocardioides panaciterrulae]
MLSPSGDQFEIGGGGYRAVVTECGGGLRVLEHQGRPLLDGYDADAAAWGGRGQLLMPWPNRLRDGAYSFGGRDLQLALSEPKRSNASHGLVRWTAWTLEEHTPHSVSLVYRLMAQTGYPWTLDLHVLYDLSADGLTVTQTATNMSAAAAPYASGAHPYLRVGAGPVDRLELTVPAATRALVDDRLIPVGSEPVEDTAYDFRMARPIRQTHFDDGFTDLERDEQGVATVVLRDPASGEGVALWADRQHRWLQVYTADDAPATARRSLAVEPMTAPANAFRSGQDLLTLAPAGETGDEHSASWGIRALD